MSRDEHLSDMIVLLIYQFRAVLNFRLFEFCVKFFRIDTNRTSDSSDCAALITNLKTGDI